MADKRHVLDQEPSRKDFEFVRYFVGLIQGPPSLS